MDFADRISHLPPYLFAEIDKKIAAKKAAGVDVISLGMGDPVEPTPQHIIDRLCRAANDPATHRYPSYYGVPEFRSAIAAWYRRRFSVDLDPEREVLPLIGSKEGIAHIFQALCDEEDIALIPDPGYPVYQTGAILAGADVHYMPLLKINSFNPDLEMIDTLTLRETKVMFLNYPNNPTAGVASFETLKQAVRTAKEFDFVLCHDFAYSELTFDGYVAPSIFEVPGAKEVAVEFQSLSKMYNMTGWRCGWVVGNARVIEALGRVKTNIDSGIFNAIQIAGIEALEGPQDIVAAMRQIYSRRRDLVADALNGAGIPVTKPLGTVFVWVEVPEPYTSASFATHVLDKAGVVVSPGNAYGPSGEGYIRISLTVKDDRLEEALERMGKVL